MHNCLRKLEKKSEQQEWVKTYYFYWISVGIFKYQGILINFVSLAREKVIGFFTPLSYQVHEPEAEFLEPLPSI